MLVCHLYDVCKNYYWQCVCWWVWWSEQKPTLCLPWIVSSWWKSVGLVVVMSYVNCDKSSRTSLHRLSIHIIYILCTEFACTLFPHHFPELTLIFSPLFSNFTLDFPVSTFSHLSRRLTLYSATRHPSCSIVGAMRTKSSAYSNSEVRPILASLETTCMTTANINGQYKPLMQTNVHLVSPAYVLITVQASKFTKD